MVRSRARRARCCGHSRRLNRASTGSDEVCEEGVRARVVRARASASRRHRNPMSGPPRVALRVLYLKSQRAGAGGRAIPIDIGGI